MVESGIRFVYFDVGGVLLEWEDVLTSFADLHHKKLGDVRGDHRDDGRRITAKDDGMIQRKRVPRRIGGGHGAESRLRGGNGLG